MYQFKPDFTGVIRLADGLAISFDDSDPNKPEFEAWAAAGNLPTPPTPPEPTLDELKGRMLAALADVRYRHETGGVMINGSLVKTDRESQATITGAYARATTNPATVIEWKADNGFVTLDAAAIIHFGGAVFDHVQGCFARERALSELIDAAATIDDLIAIDIEAGWEV